MSFNIINSASSAFRPVNNAGRGGDRKRYEDLFEPLPTPPGALQQGQQPGVIDDHHGGGGATTLRATQPPASSKMTEQSFMPASSYQSGQNLDGVPNFG